MRIIDGKEGNIALVDGDNCICRFVEETGRLDHDTHLLNRLRNYIPKGGTVLDVGAFIGDHTKYYSDKVGEHGHVLAIEPDKDNYECLMFNLGTFRYKNVLPLNIGLGEKVSSGKSIQIDTNKGMNYVTAGDDFEILPMAAIGFKRLDFIKIDVEGMEMEVLKGGAQIIQEFKPVMLIEINRMTLDRKGIRYSDIFDYLTSIGYKFRNIYDGIGLNGEQFDIICEPI